MATKDEVLDDELAGLSADERAALEGDDDDVEALEEIAGEDDSAEDVTASATDETDDTEAEDAEEDDEVEDTKEFVQTYRVDPVENFADQIQSFTDQKKALREQLNAGEIDLDAYETQKDEIVANEQNLREQNLKATIAAEQSQQNVQARWQWEQEKFFAEESNKLYANSKPLMAALDASVKELAANPDNAQRSAAWFLQEADRQVRSAFGQTVKVEKTEEKPKSRKPDLSVIPKTLAGLPAAELNDVGNDEFAKLDSLDGIALENALSKLSPEQQSRYLGIAA